MTDLNPYYADGCESCGQRHVFPDSGIPDGAHGLVAAYRCPGCGHTWTCGWAVVPGRVMPPEPIDPARHDRQATAQLYEQAAVNRARKHLARPDAT